MPCININLIKFFSDKYMFPLIQVFLVVLTVFALIKVIPQQGANLSVERGPQSMALFYGFYAATSGLLVAICLSTDVKIAKDYRIFWSLLDVLIILHLCLYNSWFRNKLLGWAYYLTKIET